MDESLTRLIREAMPLAAALGFEGLESGSDAVVVRGTWAPERCTAAGVLHGGYLMSLADVAAATLAYLNLARAPRPPRSRPRRTSSRRYARLGDRARRARPVGRRTIVVQVDVTDDAGRLVSRTLRPGRDRETRRARPVAHDHEHEHEHDEAPRS